ncbi:MAG: hypothetical protein BMS9Abin17_0334 [Acidimicrobiia bacterium]|nr:MAG: hypothetical protein BMS9Abin17_0334 [Acidimicrobiia bacterium]
MNDVAVRVAAVIVVLGLARLVALVLARFLRPKHPDVIVGDEGDRPGIVLFTSTDCSTCKRAISRIHESGLTFREITYDLEPQRFDAWGVTGVPLTIVLDAAGSIVDGMSGVPSIRRLRRAAQKARIERGS